MWKIPADNRLSRPKPAIALLEENLLIGIVITLLACFGVAGLLRGFASPQALAGTPPSDDAIDRRVESILTQMTLEEKIDMLGGVDGFYTHAISRLGVPRLKMADGPLGVRNYGPSTTMAAGIALAATWDTSLAERVGLEIGRDARARGVHFLLGPGVNLHRAPMNGRNFEYFGEDPWLASRIAVAYIQGVQSQGVSATIKHYMANNSEFDRHNTDAVIDDRTLREIYLPVFEAAVKEAHVGAVMASYNLTNGQHMTENPRLDSQILKKEWGFDGVLMSDWGATYSGVEAANAGLDLEMPFARFLTRETLEPAVSDGRVSLATIDDKVRRLLRLAVRFGWLDRDQTDHSIPRDNPQGREAALQSARESMVLLKNRGNLLPLSATKVKSIAVFGPDAEPAVVTGGGSAGVRPFAAVSFLEGIQSFLGGAKKTTYNRGIPSFAEMAQATNFSTAANGGEPGLRAEYFDNLTLEGSPVATYLVPHLSYAQGVFGGVPSDQAPPRWSSVRWSGYYLPKSAGDYEIFVEVPGDNVHFRLWIDDKPVFDAWSHATCELSTMTLSLDASPHRIVLEHLRDRARVAPRIRLGIVPRAGEVDPEAVKLASHADAAVVAVGFDPETETEGADRSFHLPPGQDELIQQIAAANKNTIVVIISGGAVDMRSWLERAPAVLEAWYPGQEGGRALADILFGEANPSGHLPVAFENAEQDNPTYNTYYPEEGSHRVVYKEGILVGYRGYPHNGVHPLFPFGFGLSYTQFSYRNLKVTSGDEESTFDVSFEVVNVGSRSGGDVAQVYVARGAGDPYLAISELKGFVRVTLRPGQVQRVSVPLGPRAFSYFDPDSHRWRIDAGEVRIFVGDSAEHFQLTGQASLPSSAAAN